jgi:Glycosyl transferases group 1
MPPLSIALMAPWREHKIGSGSYSPGLEYDAIVYEEALRARWNVSCHRVSPFYREPAQLDGFRTIISMCDAVIGFEELGTPDVWKVLLDRKQSRPEFKLILVPNLEVMQDEQRMKWFSTLSNLHHIDVIVEKAPSLRPLLNRLLGSRNCNAVVVPVFHHSPDPTASIEAALPQHDMFVDPARRRNIIHFAGASYLKNSAEACRAGVALVRKYPQHFDKLIVQMTKWPNGRFKVEGYGQVQRICRENQDVIELVMGGFISDEERAALYCRAKLALCCSRSEGFGHYILEAARFGCMVVTTNGPPMKDVLCVPGTFELARPNDSHGQPLNFGVQFSVQSTEIVACASKLLQTPYDTHRIHKCVQNYHAAVYKFHRGLKRLLRDGLRIPQRTSAWVLYADEKTIATTILTAYSLRLTATKHDIVCMFSELSYEALRQLQLVCSTTVHVPRISFTSKRTPERKLDSSFTKWSALDDSKLPYRRVAYLDSGSIVLENIDSLLEMKYPAATFAHPGSHDPTRSWGDPYADKIAPDHHVPNVRDGFYGSFTALGSLVVMKPDRKVFHHLCKMIKARQPFGFEQSKSPVDHQAIIRSLYEQSIPLYHIHRRYNYVPGNFEWLQRELLHGTESSSASASSTVTPAIIQFGLASESDLPWHQGLAESSRNSPWWQLASVLCNDEKTFSPSQQRILRNVFHLPTGSTVATTHCWWCNERAAEESDSKRNHALFSSSGAVTCPNLVPTTSCNSSQTNASPVGRKRKPIHMEPDSHVVEYDESQHMAKKTKLSD